MNLKDIQELIKFVAKSGATEVDLEIDNVKISIKSPPKKKRSKEEDVTEIIQQVVTSPVAPAPIAQVTPITHAPVAVNTEATKTEKPNTQNTEEEKYITTFQSRFGRAEWLKPYTSETMENLPTKNIKNILVVAPGFSVDCLETIEEIDEENKEIFINAGGNKFDYAPCLNDSNLHVSFIKNLIQKQTSIWK